MAANKTPEEIGKIAKTVWDNAEHFAGKLYALLLFKKANAPEKFNEYYKLLDKTKKFTHISGCMFYFSSLGELDKPEKIFNISSAFDKYYEKFPTWFYNPFDENNKRIPLITPKFEIVQSAVKEDNLGYLPTRFRDGKAGNVLKYPALAKLAKEWDCAESQGRKNTLQNLQNENNVWLCPIFKKCNKQKLAELKAKHLKILGLLSKEQRQKYDELHKKYPAITDL